MGLDAGKVVAYLTLDTSKFESGIATGRSLMKTLSSDSATAAKKAMAIGDAMASTGKIMTLGLTAPILGLGTAAVHTFTSFDDAMRQVRATMNASEEDTVKLTEAAQQMGIETRYSASEAASALNYLALAGYDADKAISALPTVLNLAQAGGLDLAYASDLATDAMAALGIEMGRLEEFTDQMARTSQKSNTNVAQLGEAILTVGGTAKVMAGGTAELNASLGVLANRGIKGAEGGTMLRNVLLALQTPTDDAKKKLKDLGISIYDSSGNLRALNEIFEDFNAALSGKTGEERTDIISTIFNKRDLKAAEAMLAGVGDEFDALMSEIQNSDGAASQMAETMEAGLGGSMRSLRSALEGLAIEFGENLAPVVKDVTDWVTQLARGWANLSEDTQNAIIRTAAFVAAAGPVLIVVGKLITGVAALSAALAGPAGLVTLGVVAVGALAGALALLPGELDAVDAALARVDTDRLDAFKRGLEKGSASLNVDVEAKVPDAGSIYDKVFAALTDGKPDTKKQKEQLQAEIQGYYDGLVSEINLNTEAQLKNLKEQLDGGFISMEEYQTRADAISSENGILIADVQKTCADSLAYVSEMSGKSTEEVKASMDRLEELKACAAAAKAEVEKLIAETESAEAKQAQLLVKAGVKTDNETTGLAFSTATNQAKIDTYKAEEAAKGKRNAADTAFAEGSQKPGITDAEMERLKAEHDARVAQIEADLAADKARIQAALLQTLNEMFAGLSSQDGAVQTGLLDAFEKLDVAAALQEALNSGDAGWVASDSALMERVAKALGIDDPASFLESFLTTKDTAGYYSAIETYIARLTDSVGSAVDGLDTSPMGVAMQGLIESGMLEGLEFDELSMRDKLALALGKLNLPQSIVDAMKQPAATGAAPGGDSAVTVPVEIEPEPKVEGAPAAVKAAVEESVAPTGEEGAPAVSVTVPVSVTPEASAEEGSGSKLVDAIADSIADATGRAKGAGDALARAVVIAFRSQIGSAKTAGRDMVQGLINGAEEKRATLISKFEGLMLAAIRAAKQKAGIASPSKVFRGIGNNIADSFALGVDERMATSQQALERLVGVPSSAQAAPTAQAAFDYDRLAAASSSKPVYLYLDGKLLAQATAADNTRAVAERQRRLDIGKGLV